jgi:coenzyme F420-reducing hydrogenase beta subunit
VSLPHCYLARARDPDVLLRASSGGFTREFLAGLLRYDLVDQVCYVQAGNGSTNLTPIVSLTSDPNVLLEADNTSSVYYPVNPVPVLKKAQGRVAATLLVCHLLDARSRAINLTCTVELLCKLAPAKRWTREQVARLSVDIKDVVKLAYRYGTPPGNFTVWTTDGRQLETSFRLVWPDENRQYFPSFCAQCAIGNAGGDIICCDPWHIPDSIGNTLIKINTEKWHSVVLRLEQEKRLLLQPVSHETWLKNQGRFLKCKESRK